jgi:ATP-binding cassette subfamily F protein 3
MRTAKSLHSHPTALAQVAQDMPRLTKAPRSTSLKAMSCLWQPRLVEAADASGDGERIGNAYMELYDATGYDAESARRRDDSGLA